MINYVDAYLNGLTDGPCTLHQIRIVQIRNVRFELTGYELPVVDICLSLYSMLYVFAVC